MVETKSAKLTSSKIPVENNLAMLNTEYKLMLAFAIQKGISLPSDSMISDVTISDEQRIVSFNSLAATISPVNALSINFINSQIYKDQGATKWYNIPVFTKCLIIAFVALIALICVSLLPSVNEENMARGLLASSGWVLFYNLLFICSASLLGVMFFLLKTISGKIKNYTLKPSDVIELNATILIGVISGFIIAELFTLTLTDSLSTIEIHKMTLALLGGFSSDAIFSTLQGIINKIKYLLAPGEIGK